MLQETTPELLPEVLVHGRRRTWTSLLVSDFMADVL